MTNEMHGEHVHMPHVGKRKLKSVLAVFVAFWFWQFIRIFFPELEVHPIFIYVYSMIEIRDSSEKTVSLGMGRIKATFVGLGVGLPVLAVAELLKLYVPSGWMHTAVEVSLLLIGVLITLIVAEQTGCDVMCGLAAAIFIIMMASHANDERYLYAVLRAVQTIFGVFIAWLINVRLFPYKGKPEEIKET